MNSKPTVIFPSASGFPFKISAANHKYKLMAKALIQAGYEVLLLTKLNTIQNLENNSGEYEGIKYIFLSGSKRRYSLPGKIIGSLKAYIAEFLLIMNYKPKIKYNYLILSYCAFPLFLYYWLLGRLFKYKLVISIMEYHPAVQKGFFAQINAKLFDYCSFYFVDGAIPISNFLYNFIKDRYSQLPQLILPVLADSSIQINNSSSLNNDEPYFLYCGSIGFKDVIDFVVETFSNLGRDSVKLKLVLSGKDKDLEVFCSSIININIGIYVSISYDELYSLYKNALGLLIPLRPNLQDKARFPQKIAEYLSSGRPIITNNYGEIPYYFKDNKNAFIGKEYDIEMYKEKLIFILDNPVRATEVGLNGKKLAREKFHYENYNTVLHDFLKDLSN